MPKLIETLLLVALLFGITPFLGKYLAAVYTRAPLPVDPLFGGLERLSYRIAKVDPTEEMTWTTYGKHLLVFNFCGFIAVFLLQLTQGVLPLNPQHFPGTSWDLAFNTAVSFTTNTNWQAYAGETTLSYLTQTLGLTVQNFLSAATGMSVLLVLIRGLSSQKTALLGNFWSDLVRSVIYILLPLSLIFSLFLVSQGVIQNISPYIDASPLEMGAQTIPMGPAASQVAIKQLGSNGGGFFNANSSHPFENPTALTNFFETLAILLIPSSAVYMYGVLINSRRQAWFILSVMFTVWALGVGVSILAELQINPIFNTVPAMEGIETRLGPRSTAIWSTSTTSTSNGSVNGMMSSLNPLAGGVALFNMMLEETIFGGVGVGLCGMLMFILLTVFLSGLMVGRTPEYLGKKIEKRELLWIICATLVPEALILIGAGVSSVLPIAKAGISHQGPHGLTEILYAFSSAAGNNGSAFAGIQANSLYYNLVLGFVMLIARLSILIPSLAIAGSLAIKKTTPSSVGTLTTTSPLFAVLLICIIFIVGILTFSPALSLGPILEHFLMLNKRSF